MEKRTSACRYCGEQVIWTTTETDRKLSVDPAPNAKGNVIITTERGEYFARVLKKDEVEMRDAAAANSDLYMPHPATCRGFARRPE